MTTNVSSFVKSFDNVWLPSFVSKAKQAINEANGQRKKDAETLSPIDTGDYIKSHKIENAKEYSSRVEGSLYNDSKNAFGVEFGFQRNDVNRHKKQSPNQPYSERPIIYNGRGANVYQRLSRDVTKVLQIYKKYLG